MKYFSKIMMMAALLWAGVACAQQSITGTIVSVGKGGYFTVKADSLPPGLVLQKGDFCSVSKDISGDNNPFGIHISSGWMSIGDAVFVSASATSLNLRVYKESAEIVINGEKQKQFTVGRHIRIEWK